MTANHLPASMEGVPTVPVVRENRQADSVSISLPDAQIDVQIDFHQMIDISQPMFSSIETLGDVFVSVPPLVPS
jgi:hypothetical protein